MKPTPAAIAAAYLAALLQGLALVSFPASGAVLRQMHALTDVQYGLIFIPQVIAAIVGSLLGGSLAGRLGLKRLLWLALLANALSQLVLAAQPLVSNETSLPLLLAATGTMGFGFGLMGSPMNAFPVLFFPTRSSTALVAMHSINGAGLMIGPLLMQGLSAGFGWVAFPLVLMALALVLVVLVITARFGDSNAQETSSKSEEPAPSRSFAFWIFASIAVVYALAEGSFSNWAVVYLQDSKHLTASAASFALSAFWGALVAGRLLIAVLVLRVPVRLIWRVLPILMALAFLLLPSVDSSMSGVLLFALAGLGCSAFFPLTVSLTTTRFPKHLPWVSAMMIAALMSGTGLGSFLLGALHAQLSFEQLYRISVIYPLAALSLSFLVGRSDEKSTG